MAGFLAKLKRGLSKTHSSLFGRLRQLVSGTARVDAETLDELGLAEGFPRQHP